VSSASVNLTTETAIVWPISEAKNVPNWQRQLGEALAEHLTSCGYNSSLRGIIHSYQLSQSLLSQFSVFLSFYSWYMLIFHKITCMVGYTTFTSFNYTIFHTCPSNLIYVLWHVF